MVRRPAADFKSAEQILVERAQQRCGPGSVLVGEVALEAAHDDGGLPAVLAAGQVGGRRGLVGSASL